MKKDTSKQLLNNEFIKSVSRTFAYDLVRYSESGGDMENVTAAKVYEFLEKKDKQFEKSKGK